MLFFATTDSSEEVRERGPHTFSLYYPSFNLPPSYPLSPLFQNHKKDGFFFFAPFFLHLSQSSLPRIPYILRQKKKNLLFSNRFFAPSSPFSSSTIFFHSTTPPLLSPPLLSPPLLSPPPLHNEMTENSRRRESMVADLRREIRTEQRGYRPPSTWGNTRLEAKLAEGHRPLQPGSPKRRLTNTQRESVIETGRHGLQPSVHQPTRNGKQVGNVYRHEGPTSLFAREGAGISSETKGFLDKPGKRVTGRSHSLGVTERPIVENTKRRVNSPRKETPGRRAKAAVAEPSNTRSGSRPRTSDSPLRHKTSVELNERQTGRKRTGSLTGAGNITSHDQDTLERDEIYHSRSYHAPVAKLAGAGGRRYASSPQRSVARNTVFEGASREAPLRGRGMTTNSAEARSSSLPLPGGGGIQRADSYARSPMRTGSGKRYQAPPAVMGDVLNSDIPPSPFRTARTHMDGPPRFIPPEKVFTHTHHKRPGKPDLYRSDVHNVQKDGFGASCDPFLGLHQPRPGSSGVPSGTPDSPRVGRNMNSSYRPSPFTDPITHRSG